MVAEAEVEKTLLTLQGTGLDAWRIGHTVADPERTVRLHPENLAGHSKHFFRE